MIDIHTHILSGIDDGSKSLENSIKIMEEAKKNGYTKIVVTPHYIEGSYETDNEEKLKLLQIMQQRLKEKNLDIELLLGNEVFITENIFYLIKNNKVCTINNSRYLLIELPRNDKIFNIDNYIFALKNCGIIPIIAHPERYRYVQENPNILIEYIEKGALFQLNTESLIGSYGRASKKTAKILVENNMVQFLATDSHRTNREYDNITNVKKLLLKLTDEENINRLMSINPDLVIKNQDIDVKEPIRHKKIFKSGGISCIWKNFWNKI
ncbi:MAG: hypothetical protein N2749_03335 [Clostridia bacterium]|nr:hypothetical protein [Clostridia bacterium]